MLFVLEVSRGWRTPPSEIDCEFPLRVGSIVSSKGEDLRVALDAFFFISARTSSDGGVTLSLLPRSVSVTSDANDGRLEVLAETDAKPDSGPRREGRDVRDELLGIGGMPPSFAFDSFVVANDTLETREDPEACVSLLLDSAPINSAFDSLAFALEAVTFDGPEDGVRDLDAVSPLAEASPIVSVMHTADFEVVGAVSF